MATSGSSKEGARKSQAEEYPEDIARFLEDLKSKHFWRGVNIAFVLAELFIIAPLCFGAIVYPQAPGFDKEIVILDIMLALAGLFLALALYYATEKTNEGMRMILVMVADAEAKAFSGLAGLIPESSFGSAAGLFEDVKRRIDDAQTKMQEQAVRLDSESRTLLETRLRSIESQLKTLEESIRNSSSS